MLDTAVGHRRDRDDRRASRHPQRGVRGPLARGADRKAPGALCETRTRDPRLDKVLRAMLPSNTSVYFRSSDGVIGNRK
jgi:hypothetical protein